LSDILTYNPIKSFGSRHGIKYPRGILLLLFIWLVPGNAYSQAGYSFASTIDTSGISNSSFGQTTSYILSDTGFQTKEGDDYYDEVLVTVNIPRIGSFEIQAIVLGQQLYLPVKDLFDYLKIRNTVSPDFDLIQGFFIYPKDTYSIDKTSNKIIFKYKIFELNAHDMIRTETNLYLRLEYFGKIFDLDCVFNFRSLSVILNTKIELPAIREMRQELMRQNISQLKGENKKADTTIANNAPFFHIGMADWSVIATQETQRKSNLRGSLGIGGIVAGGELNVLLNYNSDATTDLRQQFYQWRLVNNDHSALRQVIAGKMFAQSIASVFAPVTGVQFTNTPTTYRKSFGTYTLSNTTEPEWMVELYVNNALVNFTKADASGFYTFEVPMVYGNSVLKLRFYGPWGEERTSEKYINIPFNFIPLHQFEYNVIAGMVDDTRKSLYSRTNFSYGLARRVTIGGGMEYLSSVTSGKYMPFINASLGVGQHILVSGEHTYGVRSKGVISYRTPADQQVEFNYTRYDKDQTAIMTNYLEEKRIILSMPLRRNKFTAFSRLTLNQFTLANSPGTFLKVKQKYTSAEFLFSSVISGVNSNLATYAIFSDPVNPFIYSNLTMTFRLPKGIRFTPQAQYEYREKRVSKIKADVAKNISTRGFLNVSYEKVFVNDNINASTLTVGFRYNFSFAQTFFSASNSSRTMASTQSARGSLMYDGKTNYLMLNDQSSVGKGGLVISPFLDLNCNGQRDRGEPKAFGLNLRVTGGRLMHNDHDTTLRITGLEAYTNCFLEFDKNSFDNVAWQINKKTISITIEPNNFKLIEVAVAVWGEASGSVVLDNGKDRNGLGRIIVNFYDSNATFAGRTLTESDGYFSFMKLAPGTYTAQIDSTQLHKLQMASSPALSFKILSNKDGDVVDGLRFVLNSLKVSGTF
jgi:hypothetical protein